MCWGGRLAVDFLPEAIALGATFGGGHAGGTLLAILIAMQNLPEGFNAFREMMSEGGGGTVASRLSRRLCKSMAVDFSLLARLLLE